jgi:BirA family biotin operon repressor/biotin-[acetyl-CoA-carboxylase] ligase
VIVKKVYLRLHINVSYIEKTQLDISLLLSCENYYGFTMSLQILLSVLADGEFHSGDELGSMLGVSRTAIWKQLQKIQELDLPLESTKGKGYCIPGGLDLLSLAPIQSALSAQAKSLISDIDIQGVIGSTSAMAMTRAATGAKGYVCTAEQQIAGRGRRGRTWVSPYASNLYASVIWEFAGGASALDGLSLAVGVAVVEALDKAGVNGARLKWPNDVLYNEHKLAGILLEMTGDASGPCQVVVGIGLNVNMPSSPGIDQPWTDVKSINSNAAKRNNLLALLLNELMPLLAGFEPGGFSAYRDQWQALDVYAGREVVMMLGDDMVLGLADGVDATGAMLLKTDSGMRRFNGGEVSLRVVG